jgi:hypothetical protein
MWQLHIRYAAVLWTASLTQCVAVLLLFDVSSDLLDFYNFI